MDGTGAKTLDVPAVSVASEQQRNEILYVQEKTFVIQDKMMGKMAYYLSIPSSRHTSLQRHFSVCHSHLKSEVSALTAFGRHGTRLTLLFNLPETKKVITNSPSPSIALTFSTYASSKKLKKHVN